jgi:hypothetical protein
MNGAINAAAAEQAAVGSVDNSIHCQFGNIALHNLNARIEHQRHSRSLQRVVQAAQAAQRPAFNPADALARRLNFCPT